MPAEPEDIERIRQPIQREVSRQRPWSIRRRLWPCEKRWKSPVEQTSPAENPRGWFRFQKFDTISATIR